MVGMTYASVADNKSSPQDALREGSSTPTCMHPVLKFSLEPLAVEIKALSLEEAQIPPAPGQDRWSAQQIVEHLILTYGLTLNTVNRQLKSGHVPSRRRNLLKSLLRMQTLGLGYMPNGIPSMHAVRPKDSTPMAGPELVERFLAAAEEMDAALAAGRKKFGIQPCGEHPFYGAMRVDEWRRYHSLHARHHAVQLRNAIRFAKSQGKA
jgi:Protein of unknown function (DUF1569)